MGLKAPTVVATQLWVSKSQEVEGYHICGTFMVNNLMAKMQLRELTLFDAVRLGLKIPNMHEDCVISAKNLAPTLKLLGSVCRRIVGRPDYQHLTPIQKSTINVAVKMVQDGTIGRKEDLILEELCPHLLDHDLKPFRSPSVKGVRAVACSEICGFCIRMRVYQIGRPEVDIPIYYAKKLGVEIPDEVSTQYQNLIEAERMAKKLAAWFDAGGVKSESQTTISNLGSCVKDEFRRLLPWAMKSLVMQLMARWKAGDELAKRALSELQSFSWCFGTFSLRHSLLRILELGHDIPDGYSVLDKGECPRILICDDLVGVDEAAVLTWGELLGIRWEGWKKLAEEFRQKSEEEPIVHESIMEIKEETVDSSWSLSEVEGAEVEKVRNVLCEFFKNGMRPNSIIDRNKFSRYFEQTFGSPLRSNFEYDRIIPAIGIMNEGKVFPSTVSGGEECLSFLRGLVEKGHKLLWFSQVMALHADEMLRMGVPSAEVLRKMVSRLAPDEFELAMDRFAPKGETLEALQVVLSRVDADAKLLSERDLCEQLPYIDVDALHNVLKSNSALLKNAKDSYVVVDRIELDDGEVRSAVARVGAEIKTNRYSSLALFDFPESALLNDSRVETHTLRRVFFERYLAKDYGLKGQIVIPKGASLDSRIPLRLFCRERTETTLDQIKDLCDEYDISLASGISVLHDEMVRVDAERFVSPKLIAFDTDEIDRAIESHADGNAPSLSSFRDNLSDFPSVPGYSWNVYLLESFLRRMSNAFALITLSDGNLEPVGMVMRFKGNKTNLNPREIVKYCAKDRLMEIFVTCLSRRLISAGKHPAEDEVGKFLAQNGYILRRSTKFVNRILGKMRQLLESEENRN